MKPSPEYKTCRSALCGFVTFVTFAASSLLTLSSASAATYYWDADGATPGFGSATGTTWSSAGTGNLWSTDSTGSSAVVADYATTTADDLFFGTADVALSGAVTIDGVVQANSIFNAAGNFSGTTPTINFAAEGSYFRAQNNGSFPVGTTFTGAATSFTWTSQRNLNVRNVDNSSAGSIILQTAFTTPYPYPGRTVMDKEENLGAPGAPLVFDHGTIRIEDGFPYASLSALNAAHPVSFTPDKDAGVDNSASGLTFVFDVSIDLGTGAFWSEGNGGVNRFTVANNWSRVYLTSEILEVSASEQLGPESADFVFGTDTDNLGTGTLRIAGTTFSSFGARNLVVTENKIAKFEIDDAGHTFTLDQAMTHGTGGLDKSGAGTLALSGTTNTYVGDTNVDAGTLALDSVSLASPIIVDSGAHLGLSLNVGTPATALSSSSSSVNLTNGDVTISNPGAVDGSTDYLLMTASGGFTFTDPLTQLGTVIAGYELQLQNADTELWLVVASSGTDYTTWSGGFTGFTDTTEDLDFDNGGLESGIEYVLGGDPTDASDDAGKAPTLSNDGTNLIFTFSRDQVSIHESATVTIQVGTDLAAWPDVYTVGADTAGSSEGVTVTKDTSEGFDTVTLTVPMSPDTKKFARLDVAFAP